MKLLPNTRPQMPRNKTHELLRNAGVTNAVALVGVRSYYLNSMGKVGENDRAIYDDALFIVSPETYMTVNANCDPGAFRLGIANLKCGLWKYKLGTHGMNKPAAARYEALIQADEVTVIRDGQGEDTGYFGINIHRGGFNSVSSLGCQTIHPSQWASFIATVKSELSRHDQKTIPYLLVENKGDIA